MVLDYPVILNSTYSLAPRYGSVPVMHSQRRFCLQGGLNARRRAGKIVRGIEATHMLFNVLAKRYKDRDGGYTRILRTRRRLNDRAQMAFIE